MKQSIVGLTLIAASQITYSQTVVTDANGVGIGVFLERIEAEASAGQSRPTANAAAARYDYHMLTTTGYRFALAFRPLEPFAYVRGYWDQGDQEVRFTSNDCTGQGYTEASFSGFVGNIKIGRDLDTSGVEPALWYAPKGQTPEFIVGFNSELTRNEGGLACTSASSGDRWAVEVFPNDPAITGISQAIFDMPVQFETSVDPAIQNCLFKDGFECLLQ